MCEGGVEMAPAGSAAAGTKSFNCPLRAGRIDACPLAPDEQPDWHCRPDLEVGPSVSVTTASNPRLFPQIARNSEAHRVHYASRTCCERSNSSKKVSFKLVAARRRRSPSWLIRLVSIAVLQHAEVWAATQAHPVHALLASAAAKSKAA
jgi:hypothetical protein